jgi:hypothetical protein
MAFQYVLVVGSRSITDKNKIFETLDKFCDENSVIVSGGARGVDSIAENYADSRGLKKVIMPADWNTYGKRAGYVRNEEMHRYIAKYTNRACIAFWDGISKGTAHNFDLAKKYDTFIQVIRL